MPFDLEAEVRDLAARRDITEAVHRYMRGLDRLDPALQRSAFHDDAQIDAGIFVGDAGEFVGFCQDFLGAMDASHHLLGQVRIEIDGSNTGPIKTARGECYFQAWHGIRDPAGNPRDLFIAGRYVDDYACKNGEWRIVRRKLITDWVKDDPADHGFFAANPTTNRAGRRGEDFSDTRVWAR
ncbi:nuclear transport factor 2 family protein [Novosphingobium sp. JCM 18896]|uniref:nuclear transport factor 2 family protein n=1 Tax=Novosphingobium sp. JCM 18896 TaxID=2989731 RepID=UPI0022225DAF|nr:nuclear transport factor 2 family protein [Novosphingobium sp. JCM 18896]MCW1431059.1 nuclear transport factor 2 family protein [Novosphingobium sp. JCM 18896]